MGPSLLFTLLGDNRNKGGRRKRKIVRDIQGED